MEVQTKKLYENPRLHAQLLAEGAGSKGGKGKWGGKGDSGGNSLAPKTAPGGSRATAAERHQRSEAERVEPMVPAARLSHVRLVLKTGWRGRGLVVEGLIVMFVWYCGVSSCGGGGTSCV
jgi:hypothetical protein